jgi:ketosteroid isomerase-like protein
MRGKQAFTDSSKNMEGMKIAGQSEIQEIHVAGELAYAWTNLTVRVTSRGGATVKKSGHSLTIFQKQSGGRWVLFRDANMLTANPGSAS